MTAASPTASGPPSARWSFTRPTEVTRILPLFILVVLCFDIPLLVALGWSVRDPKGPDPTLQHYIDFTTSSLYLPVIWRTVELAAIVTFVCAVLGYPLALWITRLSAGRQIVAIGLVIIPFWISILVRTYAWIVILGNAGVVNRTLKELGLIEKSIPFLYNELGVAIGMVNVLTDVTKQRELDEMKNQFVSNVTHELRTPIVAMQKSLEILSSSSAGPLNEAQTNFLHIVSRNLTHLSTLVEDVLDVSRIDSGNVKIRMGTHDLLQTIQDACNALDMWAKSKEIEIVQKTEKIPQVQLDRDKITQVLNNLLSNAIKFTPKGGKITVTCEKADSGTVSVEVRDTGIGIAKENIPKLFRRFAQFGNQQGISGTGLGLCISKEIVERHGGNIRADSEEKKGSTFTFVLPLKQQPVIGGN